MLTRIGRMAVVALALPAYVRSKVDGLLDADEMHTELVRDLDHVTGERDEARRWRDAEVQTNVRLLSEIHDCRSAAAKKDAEIAELRDEVKILTREAVDLRTDVAELTEQGTFNAKTLADVAARLCATTKDLHIVQTDHAVTRDDLATIYEIGWRAIVERNRLAAYIDDEHEHAIDVTTRKDAATEEANRLRAELAALKSKVEPAPIDVCAWCLEPSDAAWATPVGGVVYPMCRAHGEPASPSLAEIVERCRRRASSCPSRRTSPDPLAVACTFGCGMPAGRHCCTHEVSP